MINLQFLGQTTREILTLFGKIINFYGMTMIYHVSLGKKNWQRNIMISFSRSIA